MESIALVSREFPSATIPCTQSPTKRTLRPPKLFPQHSRHLGAEHMQIGNGFSYISGLDGVIHIGSETVDVCEYRGQWHAYRVAGGMLGKHDVLERRFLMVKAEGCI